jgi:YVTN family beta-propeller protein
VASQEFVYVCNQNSASITVINVETLEIEETIDLQELGFSSNAKPHHAAVEPDGSFWYVTLIGENRVLKFNAENELVAQTEMEVPGLISLHQNEDVMYVGRSMSAVNPPQSFGVISRSDMSLNEEVDLLFSRPHAITSLTNKEHVFVASLSSNQILSIDTESGDADFISMDGMNHMFINFAVSPDEMMMVGTTQMTGKMLVFDISDPLSLELTNTLDVNAQPWHPVFSNDGKYVYFGNKEANSITAINMETQTVESVIEGEGLAQPHGAVLSSDNKYLFISNSNMKMGEMHSGMDHGHMMKKGSVAVVDTETFEIVKLIEVGMNPTGMGAR